MATTKRILVTGAAGYIGSVLCELLSRRGDTVVAIDNLMYGQSWNGFPADVCKTVDILEEKSISEVVRDVDAVVHLAAIVGAPACAKNPDLSESVNFIGSTLLAHYAFGKPIVYPNTNSGYGNQGAVDETTPLKPLSLYAKHKGDAEEVLLGANAVSLRLATAFGVSRRMRLDLLVNDLTNKAVKDGYLVIFERNFYRNFVHVRDVARAMMFSLDNFDKMSGNIYNVGLDEANITKEGLANRIKRYTNCYVHFADFNEDPDKRNYIVSHKKLMNLGFEYQTGLDAGIQEVIEWSKHETLPYRNI